MAAPASAAGEAVVNAAVTSVTKGAEAASTAASAEGRSLIWRAAAVHHGLLRVSRAQSRQIAVATTTTMLGFIIGAFMCAYSQRVVKKRFVEALAKMRGRKGDQSAQPTKLSWLESSTSAEDGEGSRAARSLTAR